MAGEGGVDRVLHLHGIADGHGPGIHRHAMGAKQADERLQLLRRTPAGDDGGAEPAQQNGDRLAEAAAGAGDQRHLALKQVRAVDGGPRK